MQDREVRIDSYFSLPTDLAAEMRAWPEFRNGEGYAVTLASAAESVEVGLGLDDDVENARQFVYVRGEGSGPLFHRVLGTVVHAMSAHSDDVWITRWGSHDT